METFIQLLSTLMVLAGGALGTYGFTEIAKYAKELPFITKDNKPMLRATAGVLAGVAVIITSLADGKVAPESIQSVVMGVLQIGVMWGGAHMTHKAVKEYEAKQEASADEPVSNE